MDPFWAAVITAPRGSCAIASISDTINGSGILSCTASNQYSCGMQHYMANAAARNRMTAAISSIGVQHGDCLVPASNALTALNAMTLPGSYIARRAGGTLGPHNSGNYVALHVEGCSDLGIASVDYLGAATSAFDGTEMSAYAEAPAFVASFDATGVCGAAQNLDVKVRQAANGLATGSRAVGYACDFGANNPALPDCPAQAERTAFHIGGITQW